MKLWIDGSTTKICYIFEGQDPVICEVGSAKNPVTSNQGEYYALLTALVNALRQGVRELDIYSDSELMVRQVNREYAVKNQKLQILHRKVLALMDLFDKVNLSWIAREENPAGRILG